MQAVYISSVFSTSVSLFWSLFGLLDLDKLKNCTSAEETVGKIVFGIWLIQAMILLLNMLIALITNKFDEVQVGHVGEVLSMFVR